MASPGNAGTGDNRIRKGQPVARAHRFFASGAGRESEVRLDSGESHRFLRVLRLGSGAEVEVFDGAGRAFSARLVAVDADGRCRLERGAPAAAREAAVRLTLAAAIPKGDAFTDICRQLSEVGAAAVVPLLTERTEGAATPARLRRWRAAALAGARQSGRAGMAEVLPAASFGEWLRDSGRFSRRWIAAPARDEARAPSSASIPESAVGPTEDSPVPPDAVVAAIGPEGGFTPDEAAAALRRGFARLDLGERILRAPTAAAVAAWWLLNRPDRTAGCRASPAEPAEASPSARLPEPSVSDGGRQ